TSTAEDEAILPTEIDQYMLGGYGGIRTKGRDVLGDERRITYLLRTNGGGGGGGVPGDGEDPTPWQGHGGFATEPLEVWPWTRSEVSSDPEDLGGSPFAPSNVGDTNEQLEYGNPNGFRDAIILVLTAGDDNKANAQ
ncbi:hypothetical protein JW859_05510, partial [bacterium]|nr:hypothetical protein [bacterium]